MQQVSRRGFLLGAAGVAGSVALPGLFTRNAWATDDGVFPRFAWQPVHSFPAPRKDALFPTLLPVGHLTPGTALDAWYLWAWTHDDPTQLHLYTAAQPEGPYTDRGIVINGMLSPTRAGYDTRHFDSGDIVWDAAHSRYVSSPHSLRSSYDTTQLAEAPQDSFLIQSTDGVNWSWLDGDNSPRLVCSPPGNPDDVHTGYGRLLRDLDGFLTQTNGKYAWLYRAQRHDAGAVSTTIYRPWVATAPALSGAWTKASSQAYVAAAQPNVSLIGVGSFIRAVNQLWVEYACATTFSAAPANEVLLGGANTTDDLTTAKQQPVSLGPDPNNYHTASNPLAAGGGNIIRDPATGTQYLVLIGFNAETAGSSTAVPQITIYRSAT
jgi:hypothetical protein